MSRVAHVSTAGAVAVLAAAGYPLTPRQIRYVWSSPARADLPVTAPRVFDEVDLSMLAVFAALAARCRRFGLPQWMARAALRYREGEVRAAIQRRQPRCLVLDPVHGTVHLSETADRPASTLDLLQLRAAVAAALAEYQAVTLETAGDGGEARTLWVS